MILWIFFQEKNYLYGKTSLDKLKESTVAIFGIGGVGSYVAETLARAGIGNIILIDSDKICESNINRQIHATTKTIGKYKVEVMKERILDINKEANVTTYTTFVNEENIDNILSNNYDYIVDAIDTISSKLSIILHAKKNNINIISSMGAANKLDPTKFEVSDIKKTSVCPVAKILRKKLKDLGIANLKVVYSKEEPLKINSENLDDNGKKILGSISFVPSAVGIIISSEVVKDIIHPII